MFMFITAYNHNNTCYDVAPHILKNFYQFILHEKELSISLQEPAGRVMLH